MVPLEDDQDGHDVRLIEAICAGDEGAMMIFYDRHFGLVAGYCRRLLWDAATAEEAIQDTFLQVWRLACTFDPGRARPTTWLFVLARTRCLDALRRAGRRAEFEVLASGPSEDEPEAGLVNAATASGMDPTAEAVVTRLEGDRMRRALGSLPAAQRQTLQATYVLGMSASEVSLAQNVPVGTVKTRVRLGLRHLRGLLEVDRHAP
jgi:RNA polymerase sigma-70 factor, ECF subfamily